MRKKLTRKHCKWQHSKWIFFFFVLGNFGARGRQEHGRELRADFYRVLLTEFCGKLGEFCQKLVSSLRTQIKGWEEITEFSTRNSVRAKKVTEFGVWSSVFETVLADTVFGPFPTHPRTSNSTKKQGRFRPYEPWCHKPVSLNGCLGNSVIGGCKKIRQPFANPPPTLRQPFANLFCQPFLPTFSANPSFRRPQGPI